MLRLLACPSRRGRYNPFTIDTPFRPLKVPLVPHKKPSVSLFSAMHAENLSSTNCATTIPQGSLSVGLGIPGFIASKKPRVTSELVAALFASSDGAGSIAVPSPWLCDANASLLPDAFSAGTLPTDAVPATLVGFRIACLVGATLLPSQAWPDDTAVVPSPSPSTELCGSAVVKSALALSQGA